MARNELAACLETGRTDPAASGADQVVAAHGREIILDRAWSTKPDATSRFGVLNGSSGMGETDWRPEAGSAFAGNDTLITLGNFSNDPAETPRYDHTMVGASSFHSGGVNVGFLDGSVKFIKNSINMGTWGALATKAGGEVVDASSY